MATIAVREDPTSDIVYIRPAELNVLRLVVTGKTSQEIAEELGCSPKTVEVHRHNVLKRTGCCNTFKLIGLLFKEKILSWDGDTLA